MLWDEWIVREIHCICNQNAPGEIWMNLTENLFDVFVKFFSPPFFLGKLYSSWWRLSIQSTGKDYFYSHGEDACLLKGQLRCKSTFCLSVLKLTSTQCFCVVFFNFFFFLLSLFVRWFLLSLLFVCVYMCCFFPKALFLNLVCVVESAYVFTEDSTLLSPLDCYFIFLINLKYFQYCK